MFSGFDPSLLSSPDFKEDFVREVIISPILTRLGYTPSGPDRIVRSKTLVHPFIYAGTRKVPVTLIPDYTLLGEGQPLCVLDAKNPSEDILKGGLMFSRLTATPFIRKSNAPPSPCATGGALLYSASMIPRLS